MGRRDRTVIGRGGAMDGRRTGEGRRAGGPRTRWWPPVLASHFLFAALVFPASLARMTPASFLVLPLEAPAYLLVALLLPALLAGPVRLLAAILLSASLIFRLADVGSFEAFGRPFNLVLDVHLLGAAWNLLSGAVGRIGAFLAAAAAVLLVILVVVAAERSLAVTTRFARRHRLAVGLVAAALGGLALAALAAPAVLPLPVTTIASRSLAGHVTVAVDSLDDRARFLREAAVDPVADIADGALFSGLRGRDVLLVFVESYGRAAVEGACCAARTAQALARFEQRIAAAGFSARTGWLTSTTVGGQSWLAHGTLLSGLEVDNQRRYVSLVTSRRGTLNRDFRRAGWRTVAAMPAISMAWPEGDFFGYDAIYDAHTLGYRGRPFNWVTMPDQYVLDAVRRFELAVPREAPVMAEIALISSHAPWTPIPPLIGWDEVGEGTVFNRWSDSGDPPAVLWLDSDRVREQFSISIAYSLDVLSSYVETFGDDDLVLIFLGDHQPAPLITGEGAGRDVPIHVVARDPAVLSVFAGWGWTAGMAPSPQTPVMPMRDFRARFAAGFSDGAD